MNLLLHDEQFLTYAQEIVSRATTTIDISTFKLEMSGKKMGAPLLQFFDTLYKKQKNGVTVRFLAPTSSRPLHTPYNNTPAIAVLKKNNIAVRHLLYGRCCHAKIIIVDNVTAIIGSHNLSVRSCHYNFEVSYMGNDPIYVKRLSCIYERVWETAQKV